ncbi:MAG: phenylalanine--tRNA ligase subunit alpha, partial [Staphylococcus simulans]|nr:phenylalanine--tRNA ligase subunit alpha [Staphylococcus simulans]
MIQTEEMNQLKSEALADVSQASDEKALQDVKVKYLGKKGSVSGLMKQMKDLSNEEKPKFGQAVNEVRQAIEQAIAERKKVLEQ